MPSKDKNYGGGLGARYGSTLRKRWSEVVRTARARHICPRCEAEMVRRVSVGVWACRKCGFKFAGQAYAPGSKVG